METKINQAIKSVLLIFGEKYFIDDVINKQKVIQDLDNYDKDLISKMLLNDIVKSNFTMSINDAIIFNVNKLIELFETNEYWQDSYTKYSKKIGLTVKGKFLDEAMEVVLDFPYKDTVLKAGMTKEDLAKDDLRPDEPFLNEVIAKEEIDVLLDKKLFVNAKKYDVEGEHAVSEITEDDNLILKGNNLLALHSLKERYAGKVKLIYIDPPYNTGNDSFQYNDRFNHSAWLTFMKNRLEIASELLKKDGLIVVQTDDAEQAYLKVLMDNIFGLNNYINTVSLLIKSISGASGGGEDKRLKKNVEFLTIYSKNKNEVNLTSVKQLTPIHELVEEYRQNGTSWKYTPLLLSPGIEEYVGSTVDGTGDEIKIYRCVNPIFSSISKIMTEKGLTEEEAYNQYGKYAFDSKLPQSSIRPRVMDKFHELLPGEENYLTSIKYVPKTGKNKGIVYKQYYKGANFRLLAWLKDVSIVKDDKLYKADQLGTFWNVVGFMNNIGKEGEVEFNSAKKPEQLIQKIIELSTDESDIVLDFFMGSATTQAVAMKMNRRFIGIEQMDYINTVSVPRLQKVIEGEQGGISKEVDWQGGGSLIYAELMEKNTGFLKEIIEADTMQKLQAIFERMSQSPDIDFRVDLEEVRATLWERSLEEQKKTLIKILDKNQLYFNYSEIDDVHVRELVSDSDYAFNQSFYKEVNQDG